MKAELNETHDPVLRSWVESANVQGADFPIQNLPFGVFKRRGRSEAPRVGVAIGDQVLDIPACRKEGLFKDIADEAAESCESSSLNQLMSLGSSHWSALRQRLSELLKDGTNETTRVKPALLAISEAELLRPVEIGDYTDFYASIFHATNVGSMFRPNNPLLPNYKYIPIGYHGRSSSIVISGTSVRRPSGQLKDDTSERPAFAPTRALDYELEVGAFVGLGNIQGVPIDISRAEEHLFGICILNDWSARDIQTWEYQPLGPFLAKNFASTISPWVVTMEALAPFRAPAFARPVGDPAPLPHLFSSADQHKGGIDLFLEVYLSSQQMQVKGMAPARLSRGNFKDMYWTFAQMLTHHASNGCNMRPGDLLGSGTVSGPRKDSLGSLLELTWRGSDPLTLPTGETRKFLQDGDEVIMRGFCEREGAVRIGIGECRGILLG
ncbi:MAG: fumarylacetoacetase [Bacteroidetes bacterium]|nr:fumarylacetoacetase [Bacteroidota bacterium]